MKPLAAAAGIIALVVIGCVTGYAPASDHTPPPPSPWYTTTP